MYFVYIIFSPKFNKTYVGYSSNLIQRIEFHNSISQKSWTKSFRPWILIYSETFQEKKEALIREKYLKTGVGREFVAKIKLNYIEIK